MCFVISSLYEQLKSQAETIDKSGHQIFASHIRLTKHVASGHKNKSSKTSENKPILLVHEEKKLSKCNLCEYSSEFSADLKSHMSTIHERKKPFICVICNGSFEEKIKLQKHIESVHGKKVPLDSL
jgi:hypothetical protein